MEMLADDARVERLKEAGSPFVLIGRTADTTGIDYVDVDFGAAVEKSLKHLAELGHRCVALFNFPPDQLEAGYTSALLARDAFDSSCGRARHPRASRFRVHIPPTRPKRVAAELLRASPTAPPRSRRAGSSAVS